jgi:hypothetical protein
MQVDEVVLVERSEFDLRKKVRRKVLHGPVLDPVLHSREVVGHRVSVVWRIHPANDGEDTDNSDNDRRPKITLGTESSKTRPMVAPAGIVSSVLTDDVV